ncbi:MAG: hypothetical protein GEV06_11975 [Luteitalea sp.]|nr:hypothetical protein [Luteitalea sp.]
MTLRVVISLVLAGLLLSGAASPIVRGQTPPDDPAQAPRQSSAQGMPDFSGRWVLEEVDQPGAPRGGFAPGEGYGPPGGGRFGGRPPEENVDDPARRRAMPPMEKGAIVTLTQSETELVMKFGSHERVYTLRAAKGEAGPQSEEATRKAEPRKGKSRTYWDGTSLVTEIEESFETPREETVTVTSREVRTLSNEGKTMTVETTLKTPRRTHTVTQTFRRRR